MTDFEQLQGRTRRIPLVRETWRTRLGGSHEAPANRCWVALGFAQLRKLPVLALVPSRIAWYSAYVDTTGHSRVESEVFRP